MVASFIGALMMLLCGMLPATTDVNEKDIKTVLAIGAYRAQCIMLHHCVKLILAALPGNRKELLKNNSVLLTGTTTSQQSFTTRHTVLLTLAALHRWTDFIVKPPRMVNALTRNLQILFLIKPSTQQVKDASDQAWKLYNIFKTTVFSESESYIVTRLAQEVLGDGCTDGDAK